MRYTEISKATPFDGAPSINIAGVIGASPNKPFLEKIPVSGKRPLNISVLGLPEGLYHSGSIISGGVKKAGNYDIVIKAENELGAAEKHVTLEIKQDTVRLTPLMGFTSWNAFGFEVTQENMENTARLLCELGLSEYGYNYVNIDSGWQGEYGGKFDAIMPNEKFPDMKGFCDRMHAIGFKCGIYSTPMLFAFGTSINYRPLPPGCTQGEADDRFSEEHFGIGKIRKEKNNALQWAEWGFDYLKYDWRPSDPVNAELMRQELVKTDRDFGFCVSVKARAEYHKYWEKYCQSYRCNIDSMGTFKNLLTIYRTYFDFIEYVNKGHYFDLDMLDLGECDLFYKLDFVSAPDFGFSEDEMLVAYTMRAFLNSPIQISCHLEKLSDFEIDMYCNEEIIAINQDTAFKTAIPYMITENQDSMIHIFKKVLSDGSEAYCVFNLGERTELVKVFLGEEREIRDVWAKRDLGTMSTIKLPEMPPHTVRVFKTKKCN